MKSVVLKFGWFNGISRRGEEGTDELPFTPPKHKIMILVNDHSDHFNKIGFTIFKISLKDLGKKIFRSETNLVRQLLYN